MARNARNTRFFWVMLVVLLLAMYLGIRYVSTVDSCGEKSPDKKWEWVPPGYVCVSPASRL